ncbi:tRNA1(Val) (adenine(37)-N6)-methyltransferase [Methylocapsa sp. S129]|uniref:tRNA1(Val) (adenine(37)-N6)-methyltransferase n=1 Tax=Methylocapsa sp. S129 TaxID=1641869 RepID=UPI00131E7D21|nr:methyltransferase [Methylocapsa sp. S129]
MSDPADRPGDFATSDDTLLGGRLNIRQPVKGHRAGSDAILLAAAAPRDGVSRLVDVGAGVGSVGLAALQRISGASADLVEKDADLAALAEQNAALNGLERRTRVLRVDITQARDRRSAGLIDDDADLVLTNPPFFDAQSVRASPDARRATAHVFDKSPAGAGAALEGWIVACFALLRAGGRFVMIHRPDALAQILGAFGRRIGSVAVLPIHPNAQAPAHRLLVTGVKGARGPISLRPGLILHDDAGAFTPAAEAIHRGEALIDWGEAGPRKETRTPR